MKNNIDVIARLYSFNEKDLDYIVLLDDLETERTILINYTNNSIKKLDCLSDVIMCIVQVESFTYINKNYIEPLANEIFETSWNDTEKSKVFDLLQQLYEWK